MWSMREIGKDLPYKCQFKKSYLKKEPSISKCFLLGKVYYKRTTLP